MKAVLLAGGTGSRLRPCTSFINKHLLPVYNKPMLYYPLSFLKRSGINNIIIVINSDTMHNRFTNAIKQEREFAGLAIEYVLQDSPQGTAHAISLCKRLLGVNSFIVIWGDNIFEYCRPNILRTNDDEISLFVKRVNDISQYGHVVLNEHNEIVDILYGSNPNHNLKHGLALCGLFSLNEKIFEFIDATTPNSKNELEIVDALRRYLKSKRPKVEIINGYWIDAASSFDNLLRASMLVKENGANKVDRHVSI